MNTLITLHKGGSAKRAPHVLCAMAGCHYHNKWISIIAKTHAIYANLLLTLVTCPAICHCFDVCW